MLNWHFSLALNFLKYLLSLFIHYTNNNIFVVNTV